MIFDVQQELRDLVKKAQRIHSQEKQLVLESVKIIGELQRMNAAVNLSMSMEGFIAHLGLTPNVFWKRSQAARLTYRFPEAMEMLEAGETEVSTLALVAPKITDANADLVFSNIKNKSRREVELFLSRVKPDGSLSPEEGMKEISLRFTASELEQLDRAREILSAGGKVPTLKEVILKATSDLLEKRDPLEKAERAELRKEKKASTTKETEEKDLEKKEKVSKSTPKTQRIPISAKTRHVLWLRDKGQCRWHDEQGKRCQEKSMIEIDHIIPHSRGGRDILENLQLLCRFHNQGRAIQTFGSDFMRKYTQNFTGEGGKEWGV